MSPWTSVGPSMAAGQRASSSARRARCAAHHGSRPGLARRSGQLGPTAEQLLEVDRRPARGAGRAGRERVVGPFEGPEYGVELGALPRMLRRAAPRSPRRPAPPRPRRRRCRATPGKSTTAAAQPTPPPHAGAARGDSAFSSAPTALTNTGPRGHSSRAAAPGENPPGRSRTSRGAPPPDRRGPRLHRIGHLGPRQVDAGRRTGRRGQEAAAPAAASASVMLATRRRADSALSSTATRRPDPGPGR